MKIDYYVMDPAKNYTILVETPVEPEKQALAASKLLDLEPLAEQVAFTGKGNRNYDMSLRMGGGEFCGNALRCAGGLMGILEFMNSEDDECMELEYRIYHEALGRNMYVSVERADEYGFTYGAETQMPRPDSMETVSLSYGGKAYSMPLVSYPGISHLLSFGQMDAETAEAAISGWAGQLGVKALGIMLFEIDETTGLNTSVMTPIVYVPALGSLYREHSCASGTAAIGEYMYKNSMANMLSVLQPGGLLMFIVRNDDEGEECAYISGLISIYSKGSAEVDC